MSKIVKLIYNKPFVLTLWFGLSLFAVVKSVITNHIHNNYFVFKYNFLNVIHQHNLYTAQPEHFQDFNHYGPAFAVFFAPFALMPDGLGVILWVMFNAWILYKAIQLLPLKENQYVVILLLCAHELMTASANVQSNPLIAALIILSFTFIKNKQDFWAALMIILGTFIKLYGIVGLAFFFFSDNKLKFIASLFFWSAVLFVLPMFISSPSFIIQTYHDWYNDLIAKNISNETSTRQEVCIMGMIRKIFHYPQLSNFVVVIPAIIVFLSSYIRVKYYNYIQYQLLILASTLIFAVIFSTSSESPTYIIAFAGISIWFMNLNRPVTRFEIFLLVFAFIVTSLSPSDLFPRSIRMEYIIPYKLKALPCFIIWLKIIYETLTRRFTKTVYA